MALTLAEVSPEAPRSLICSECGQPVSLTIHHDRAEGYCCGKQYEIGVSDGGHIGYWVCCAVGFNVGIHDPKAPAAVVLRKEADELVHVIEEFGHSDMYGPAMKFLEDSGAYVSRLRRAIERYDAAVREAAHEPHGTDQ